MRGEQRCGWSCGLPLHGSSPRARGTVAAGGRERRQRRFIPACAGNRMMMDSVVMGQPVHPRVRGEQTGMLRVMYSGSGSSPRARGTVHKPNSPPALARFIPACAGNRRAGSRACGRWPVHPRVRGEQTEGGCMEYRGYGSSPRARGTARLPHQLPVLRRFIPACAGNSAKPTTAPSCAPVHPRVRGEQLPRARRRGRRPGSSPRARGTGRRRALSRCAGRFIPACAGNRRNTP